MDVTMEIPFFMIEIFLKKRQIFLVSHHQNERKWISREKTFEKYLDIEDDGLWKVLTNICNGILVYLQYDFGAIEIKTNTAELHIILSPSSIKVVDQYHYKKCTVVDTNVVSFDGIDVGKVIETFIQNMNKRWKEIKKICNQDYTIDNIKEWEFDENGRYPDKIIQEKL